MFTLSIVIAKDMCVCLTFQHVIKFYNLFPPVSGTGLEKLQDAIK